MKKNTIINDVRIDGLVAGGQGIGTLPTGKKVFVWNALPGERVDVRITRNKRDFAEAITSAVIEKSPYRLGDGAIADEDLATRPWSIFSTAEAELDAKKELVKDIFERAGLKLPRFTVGSAGKVQNYRNKMEYCFWGDDEGVHLAHFRRGSHGKIIANLAKDKLGQAHLLETAARLLECLNRAHVRASELKSVIFRADSRKVAIALFVKDRAFPAIQLPEHCVVYYSNPKSPASIVTEELYRTGETRLIDDVNGVKLTYDALSFFQVNIPAFERALSDMKQHINSRVPVLDMYSGVGTIGLCLDVQSLTLVELDPNNIAMARKNSKRHEHVTVVEASTEDALEYIHHDACVIVDPPRSGLHKNVRQKIVTESPQQVIYLSCNPVTQARDVADIIEGYTVRYFGAYNFFPNTPHIETLIILERA